VPLKVLWVVPLLLLAAVAYLVAMALTAPLPPPPVAPTTSHVDFPVTVSEADGRKVIIKERPKRILATNSGLADVLVDLVETDRIAGVPTTVKEFGGAVQWYGSHPELTMFEKATAEVILSLQPDLVLWSGFQQETPLNVLEDKNIAVLRFEFYKTFAGIRESLKTISIAVGEPGRGRILLERFDSRLDEVAHAVKNAARPRVLSYSNYGTGFAVGLGESQDEIIRRAGGLNVAAEMGKQGHFQISFEQIIQLNPDWLVVSGDAGLNSPQAQIILNEPSLAGVSAVKNKRIAVVPDRYYSNINHYVVTAVEILARQLHPQAFPNPVRLEKVPPGHL
jgi:iron complex transport system substrate-binding protein